MWERWRADCGPVICIERGGSGLFPETRDLRPTSAVEDLGMFNVHVQVAHPQRCQHVEKRRRPGTKRTRVHIPLFPFENVATSGGFDEA